jgi:diguanylate cyclase (GGDEF)-like protein/PAS domain S-box-containing protein
LAKLLGADFVLVGSLLADHQSVMVVGLVAPDGVACDKRYNLSGTPCAQVIEKGYSLYTSSVATLFPEATPFTGLGVESYAGVSLIDSAGNPIGIIAAMWRRPLEEKEQPEPVLRIFSGRAGAELARTRADANLRESERVRRTLSYAVEQGPSGVVITDPDGNIEYVNAKFLETTGYTLEECLGKNPRFLKSGVMQPEIYRQIWETIVSGATWRGEMCNRKRDGELYWVSVSIAPLRDERGQINYFVELAEDITLRKQYEAQLVRQAHYDELTGLPNRILAMDRMLGAIARAERGADRVAVMFIDLDNFKQINDTLGHAVGDGLLRKAADRLGADIRETDSLSRLGGDEFLVVLPDIHDSADAERIASKIVASFAEHFMVDGHEIYSTVSIGITIYPDDGDTPGTLMRNADAAMYRAKAEGRDTHRFFSAEIARLSERRLNVENRLRRAIERQEFFPVYQAIVDIKTGRPIGAEVLLRWNSPELNPIYPDEFIAVAEDTGLIVPIGEYVLRAACEEAVSWQDMLGTPLRVAVNVSVRQFRTNDFAALVGQILAQTTLHPSLLEIEITERAVVDDVDKAILVLNSLRAMGIRISMDDFGTGYSSLSYLHDLPIDTLKIDKSFVRDIVSDSHDAKLTEAIVAIGRSLNLDVLAEGVEEKDQLEFLQLHGCDLAQGYYFSKPVPSEAFREFLRKYQAA